MNVLMVVEGDLRRHPRPDTLPLPHRSYRRGDSVAGELDRCHHEHAKRRSIEHDVTELHTDSETATGDRVPNIKK